MRAMHELYDSVGRWIHRALPSSSNVGCSEHLLEEATELVESQSLDEAVDVLLLLFAWCNRANVGWDELRLAAWEKHERVQDERFVEVRPGYFKRATSKREVRP